MGTPANPMASLMARNIIEGLASRGQNPQGSPGPSGADPDTAGTVLSERMSELQGADPGMIMRKLQQMKKETVELLPQIAFRIPGMSKHLSGLLKSLDGAIKEVEQALSTKNTVGKTMQGIGHSAAQQQPPTSDGGGQLNISQLPGGM